jgi:hypothetical protein
MLLIMDEVDGMSSGDRGGAAELCSLIATTKVPSSLSPFSLCLSSISLLLPPSPSFSLYLPSITKIVDTDHMYMQ